MASPLIFHGTLIHTPDPQTKTLTILPSTLLIIDPKNGKITHLIPSLPATSVPSTLSTLNLPFSSQQQPSPKIHYLPPSTHFLVPGLVDTHNHAPQHPTRGLGQGLHILDWLSTVTFPAESRFSDPQHARRQYSSCVRTFLKQGITTASYYGSVHGGESFEALVDACLEGGQRALVGKCNMDREASGDLLEASGGWERELRDTEKGIRYVRERQRQQKGKQEDEEEEGEGGEGEGGGGDDLVRYVVTPRFAICCSEELLRGLGGILRASDEEEREGGGGGLVMQTHFNEAVQEMEYTKKLFPQFGNEVDLYEYYGLLRKKGEKGKGKTILAHCCYMSDYEYQRFEELGCGVAHCPVSNMTVGGGFMAAPVREFLRRGINVGLGTDSGGGFSSSMLDAMRQAIIASNAREVMSDGKDKGLSIDEVFHMATLGGANVCGLGDTVGSFEVGKEFDALVIRTDVDGVMTMVDEKDDMRTVFEKFIMTGDDRNIDEVYVKGRSVKV